MAKTIHTLMVKISACPTEAILKGQPQRIGMLNYCIDVFSITQDNLHAFTDKTFLHFYVVCKTFNIEIKIIQTILYQTKKYIKI